MEYYIYHFTQRKNILQIIKDNILYANKYLSKDRYVLSGIVETQYIFTKIFIDNTNQDLHGITLIFDPKILYEQSSIYNDGWLGEPTDNAIYLDVSKDHKILTDKIKYILNDIKINNAKQMNDTDGKHLNDPVFMRHELLFIGRILLKDYLIGIVYPLDDKKLLDEIKKILKKNKMDHVKIFNQKTMPSVNEVI